MMVALDSLRTPPISFGSVPIPAYEATLIRLREFAEIRSRQLDAFKFSARLFDAERALLFIELACLCDRVVGTELPRDSVQTVPRRMITALTNVRNRYRITVDEPISIVIADTISWLQRNYPV